MICVDTSHEPLIVVRWVGEIGGAEIDRYLRAHDGLLEMDAEHAILNDVSNASLSVACSEYLTGVSHWLERRAAVLRRTCRACAVVVGDESARRAVGVFLRMHPLEIPTQVFSELVPASDWLRPVVDGAEPFSAVGTGLDAESSSPEVLRTREGSTRSDTEGEGWSPYGSRSHESAAK